MRHEAVSHPKGEASAANAISGDAIRAELQRILCSPEFRASKRCQDFLSFIVEQSLLGRAAELKERTIGVEAFGRKASYDTNEDGTVRIKATEVRRRLALYYAGPGHQSEIRIHLPTGGYAPQFSQVDLEKEPHRSNGSGVIEPAEIVPAPAHDGWGDGLRLFQFGPRLLLTGAALLVAVLLVLGLVEWRKPANVLNEFWAPVFESSNPVLIAAAWVPVYERPPYFPNAPDFRNSQIGGQAPSSQPGRTPESDYVLLRDQYVGGGDLVASARVAGMLGRMRRPYNIKVGSIAFEDLRDAPAILIGYSSDQWSAVSSRRRFYIDDSRGMVTDHGKITAWYPRHLSREFHTDEDYAVISRVLDTQTHTMLVEITGITQYGTEGAAEIVTNPEFLAEALHGAPRDWQRKNLQFVLHMNVISNYPATPRVIASYFW
jgi:hypothetical protein